MPVPRTATSKGLLDFEAAKDFAISCIRAVDAAQFSLFNAWFECRRNPDEIAVDTFQRKVGRVFGGLVDLYERADQVLTPELKGVLVAANAAAKNLPTAQSLSETCLTYHEAAIKTVHEFLNVPLIVGDPMDSRFDSVICHQAYQHLQPLLATYSGEGRLGYWQSVVDEVNRFSKVNSQNLVVHIQQECAYAKPKQNSSTVTAETSRFVAGPLQQKILRALDGQSLKKQPLADIVCAGEGTRLYRTGGIKELIDAGLVERKSGVGYFRPDAPPDGLVVGPRQ